MKSSRATTRMPAPLLSAPQRRAWSINCGLICSSIARKYCSRMPIEGCGACESRIQASGQERLPARYEIAARDVHSFAMCLRLPYTVIDHFAAMGGIPMLAVFDRATTVAVEWTKDGQVTESNALFAGVALDLGLGIELCWPASPEQKGSIENLVGWVKGSFFTQRRFLDESDLVTQLAEWRTEVNTQRPSRATGITPAVRLEEEQPRLRPLKIAPERLALRVPIGSVLPRRSYTMRIPTRFLQTRSGFRRPCFCIAIASALWRADLKAPTSGSVSQARGRRCQSIAPNTAPRSPANVRSGTCNASIC